MWIRIRTIGDKVLRMGLIGLHTPRWICAGAFAESADRMRVAGRTQTSRERGTSKQGFAALSTVPDAKRTPQISKRTSHKMAPRCPC